MTKRILTLALCLILALCALTAEALADGEPVELTICTMRRTTDITSSYSEKHWVQALEKACNVKIKWIELLEGQTDEQLTALLAGDLPDVFWAGKIMKDSIISQNTSLWRPLTEEEIRTYVPNLASFLDENVDGWLNFITYPDGNIYGLAGGKMHSTMHTTQGIPYINTQWLERLGLEKPTTMEELKTVLTAFRDQDANGNGDPSDEIPMTFKFNGSQRDIGGLFGAFGYPDTLTDDGHHLVLDGDKVVFVPTTEGYKAACKYLHENFFSQGLIDMEGFTMDKKTYNAQNQGDIANIGLFMCWNSFDLGTVHEAEYEPLSPMLGPDGTTSWGWTASNNMMSTGFSITNVCKDPELLIKWVDTFYDPYWSMQCDLGPVGINLIDNGDGTYAYAEVPEGMSYDEFRYKEAFASDGPIALTSDYFGTVISRSPGHQAKFERNENYYRKYAIYQYVPSMLMSEEDNDALSLIQTDILSYTNEMRAKWLAYGGVEEEWDAYVARLESMGLEEYVAIYQNAYTAAYGK